MRYTKTYGVNGLLEWHGLITNHGAKMKADFTNGSVTAYGVSPATFTTKNEFTQKFIEGSDQFKIGRIRIVRAVPLPEAEQPKEEAVAEPAAAEEVAEEPADDPAADEPAAEEAPAEPAAEETEEGVRTIHVASKSDAIEWLKEQYPDKNYTAAKLRAERFDKACTEHKVKFVIGA